ncbi:MAG: hydrolase [Firmicutes bacterium]|nr:hydrolase [Bacillota bacterium]
MANNEKIKEANRPELPSFTGALRTHSIKMPEEIYKVSGIVINGRRIKSVIFTTDIAIIRNCNADAVLAVYPFTPQQAISHAIIMAAPIPVFCGIGGGTTAGMRSAHMAQDAEAQGAFGVVVNAPFPVENISTVKEFIDIPIIATVVSENADIQAILDAGASILNVSAAAKTPELVKKIREKFPGVPVIATGGPTPESIKATVDAGANCISYTPPSTAELFTEMMKKYRGENSND